MYMYVGVLSTRVYVDMHICVHVHGYIFMSTYITVCICMNVSADTLCIYVCLQVCAMCVCARVRATVYVYTHRWVNVHTVKCSYMCMCT